MRVTWLGWAGAELAVGDATAVIDPLEDVAAVFAGLGGEGPVSLPEVVAPSAGRATVGMVTHLHRDHADAAALARALADGAPVLEPPAADGQGADDLALMQAEQELAAAGLERRRLDPWQAADVGPFRITALPASDGIGDPQVSWLVEADGRRLVHLGDTCWHGHWWRIASRVGPIDAALVPVNGAVVSFPHRQPASRMPVALDPDAAATAARILGARLAIPIHAEGYEVAGVYEPVAGAAARFVDAARTAGVAARVLAPGESVEL
ncbi:MAG TPA: MBL fold metallo-hydrolase [Solirubrobacteraceae bacterium]|nr:MBL fold metallo-hydrolase [Solirubrobacteraceae bacterium]